MKTYTLNDTIQIGKYLTEIHKVANKYFLCTNKKDSPYLEDIFRQFGLTRPDIFKVYGYESDGAFPFARSLEDITKAINYLLNISQSKETETKPYRIDETLDGEIVKVTKVSTGEQFSKGDLLYHIEYEELIGPIWFDKTLTGTTFFDKPYEGYCRTQSGIYPINKLSQPTQIELKELTSTSHNPQTNLDYTTEYEDFYSDLFN